MHKKLYDKKIIMDLVVSIILFIVVIFISLYLLLSPEREMQIFASLAIGFLSIKCFNRLISFLYFKDLRKLVSMDSDMKEIKAMQKNYKKFGIGTHKDKKKYDDFCVFLFSIITIVLLIITGIGYVRIYTLIFDIAILLVIFILMGVKKKH